MRFLVDECTGPSVARWLQEQGHDVFSVYDQARGISDDRVIARAYQEERILVTNDKDFGEKIYRDKKPHRGIVLLRLDDERADNKIEIVRRLLESYADKMANSFIVATEDKVRIRRM
jgi:predicted nuclease of predicted toxin-antitoxin system